MSSWEVLRYVPLIPLTALTIELFAVGWQRCSIRQAILERDNSRATDLFFFLFDLFSLHEPLILVGSLGLVMMTYRFQAHVLGISSMLHLRRSTGSFALDIVVYLLRSGPELGQL